ncbi:Oidioi.mRNA.OKI2018_I69.chr2.g4658.t1.cds [Oikopleura dioica]|uniref:Oidioi.mRNA.OKI2018_I69.chr2.g4658.t1.cds n=1 Tax=Oikopleura dioica TaxID=34765 RepID=A0ABN7T3H7_OIKDI|nr:Oidioi.mRNA.OKI2018_I69.chr2.g4658.t1.cds [Oikopleura dioica]
MEEEERFIDEGDFEDVLNKSLDPIGSRLDSLNRKTQVSFIPIARPRKNPPSAREKKSRPESRLSSSSLIRRTLSRTHTFARSFNRIVGFEKDEEQLDEIIENPYEFKKAGSYAHKKRHHDPYSRRKRFIYKFQAFGIFISIAMIIWSNVVLQSESIKSLGEKELESIQFVIGSYRFKFDDGLRAIRSVGIANLVLNSIGVVATFTGIYSGMIVYSIYTAFMTLIAIVNYSVFISDSARIMRTAGENFQKLWMIYSLGRSAWTKKFEEANKCCGFYNGLDYCGDYITEMILDPEIKSDLKKIHDKLDELEHQPQLKSPLPMEGQSAYSYYSEESNFEEEGINETNNLEISSKTDDSSSSSYSYDDYLLDTRSARLSPYSPNSPCELITSLDINFGLMYRPCTKRGEQILSVYDVCPKDVCFTEGCQPTLEYYAKWNVIIPLLIFLAVYSLGFIFGLIFIFQLTHNFRKTVGLERRRTLQRKSSRERKNIYKAPAWVSMEDDKFPQLIWGYLSRCFYSDYIKIKEG